jgi:hypothetical protein
LQIWWLHDDTPTLSVHHTRWTFCASMTFRVGPLSKYSSYTCTRNKQTTTMRRRFGLSARACIALGWVWGVRECKDRKSARVLAVDFSCHVFVLFRSVLIACKRYASSYKNCTLVKARCMDGSIACVKAYNTGTLCKTCTPIPRECFYKIRLKTTREFVRYTLQSA